MRWVRDASGLSAGEDGGAGLQRGASELSRLQRTVRVFPNIFSPFCNRSRATLHPQHRLQCRILRRTGDSWGGPHTCRDKGEPLTVAAAESSYIFGQRVRSDDANDSA